MQRLVQPQYSECVVVVVWVGVWCQNTEYVSGCTVCAHVETRVRWLTVFSIAPMPWDRVCQWSENFLLGWLTSEILGATSVYPTMLRLQAHGYCLDFYIGTGDLNSGLYTGDARALTEPSPQSLVILLWQWFYLSLPMFFCKDFCRNCFFLHCFANHLQGLLYFHYTKGYLGRILQFTVRLFCSL